MGVHARHEPGCQYAVLPMPLQKDFPLNLLP